MCRTSRDWIRRISPKWHHRPEPLFDPERRAFLRVARLQGESVNSLKRSIYVGRVAGYQAKQHEEMQAVADALSLLANLVVAWNTMKMQLIPDRWNTRPSTAVPLELIGRIAPTRTEGINLRGVFSFPIEQYAEHLLATLVATKSRAAGAQSDPKFAAKSPFLHRTEEPIESMPCEAIRQNTPGKSESLYRHFWHGNQGEAEYRAWLGRRRRRGGIHEFTVYRGLPARSSGHGAQPIVAIQFRPASTTVCVYALCLRTQLNILVAKHRRGPGTLPKNGGSGPERLFVRKERHHMTFAKAYRC
jgi:hypothetical protein